MNKVEPSKSDLCRNLLAKDDRRTAGSDEAEEVGPEVAVVVEPCVRAGRAERLAGAGAGPDGEIVCPACSPEGMAPDANACEEMTLGVPGQVIWSDVTDGPLIDVPRRDVARGDEVSQPLRGVGVDLIIVTAFHDLIYASAARNKVGLSLNLPSP